MRQVKYRLWCNNKKEWEKDAWHLTPDGRIIDSKRQIEMKSETHFLNQFTGLLDKQGVEIYEGDILYGVNGSINCLPWKWGNYMVKYEKGNHNVPLDWGSHENHDSTHWFEVIGNIYENPELLGTK